MANQCVVRLVSSDEYRGRKQRLREILASVNGGAYAPSLPHGFLSAPKGNGVARFIPVLQAVDTAVYFACMQQVDKQLAAAAVPQTFGAWELGNARRTMEEDVATSLFRGEGCPSMPVSCYNRAAWMKHWQEFWKILAARYEYSDDDAWFAMFDIANFYDSVDLHQLEGNVRAAGGDESVAINVVFNILASWNRALRRYTPQAKGLPMDLVGDCSRLLANFFLVPFDRSFRAQAQDYGGDYMRFADDMVVCASSRHECEALVFRASQQLHELGLNINIAKVQYCSKRDFERFWGFVIMDHFEAGNLIPGLNLLRKVIDDDIFSRRTTAIKRAITILSNRPGFAFWQRWVRDAALEYGVVPQLSPHQLRAFLRLYGDDATALEELLPIILDQPFTQPKAVLLRALEEFRNDPSLDLRTAYDVCHRKIDQLDDPVLNIALRHMPNSGSVQ